MHPQALHHALHCIAVLAAVVSYGPVFAKEDGGPSAATAQSPVVLWG